jgi:four helix bundle protein
MTWKPFAQNTLGRQFVKAADSIGANLVEGAGRYGHADAIHFFTIARGSARELRYWIRVAASRNLLSPQVADDLLVSVNQTGKSINALISYRREHNLAKGVKEQLAAYGSENVGDEEFLFPQGI